MSLRAISWAPLLNGSMNEIYNLIYIFQQREQRIRWLVGKTVDLQSNGRNQRRNYESGMSTQQGSVAEWSKALVLGTSLFGGVGSNPTAAKIVFLKVEINKL